MSDEDESGKQTQTAVARKSQPVVVRSPDVPAGKPYAQYRPFLRRDFWYSCAYCTMTESEAEAIRFTIDHYEPVSAKPKLTDVYNNLMYACDECNNRKGDRCPTPEARNDGHRFFRVDEDIRNQHFRLERNELKGTTNVGTFTVEAVDLNRGTLVRLRKLRQRVFDNDAFVGEGVIALSSFPIDRLGPQIRAQALEAINKALERVGQVFDDFDNALLEFAKSDILDDEKIDEDVQRNKKRLAKMRELEGLYPGTWRGRKGRRKRH